jgi:4-hydroxybenzoate polyprenyltransferase
LERKNESVTELHAPLCVDLDGALVKTNTLIECILALMARRPLLLFALPFWLFGGRAYLWRRVGPRARLNVAQLPYRAEVLESIRAARAAGASVVLVTSAHQAPAAGIAAHLGGFAAVFSGLGKARQAEALVERFGAGGFDYIGGSGADERVWRSARKALLVGGSPGSPPSAASGVAVLAPPAVPWRLFLQALRPHQWVKNLLVFVPLILHHQLNQADSLLRAGLAVLATCIAGSGAYLLNDLLDLEADRLHARKRGRPFASGNLPLETGLLLGPVLMGAGLTIAWLARPAAAVVLGAYLAASFLYSVWLKKLPAVDVVLLAGLYCLRLLIGGEASAIPLSPWTVAFSMFLFLSLALMKRYSELHGLKTRQGEEAAGRRGYTVADMQSVSSLGTASGMTAVLVIALYVNAAEVRTLYGHPNVLWLVCVIVLLWIARLWLIAGRGELGEDPVLFAVRDPWSVVLGALSGLVLLLAA